LEDKKNKDNNSFRISLIKNNFGLDKFYFLCTTNLNVNYSCFSYIKDGSIIIQMNPEIKYETRIGVYDDYFYVRNNLVNVYFTDRELLAGKNYSAFVECYSKNSGSETFETTIKPQLKNPDFIATRAVWFKSKMSYFILLSIMILFLLVIITSAWKLLRFY